MGAEGLEQLSGDAFDKAFLSHMAMHHAMGIAMTQPVAANGAHQELKELGAGMMAAQASEIDLMRGWLKDWYGIDVTRPTGMQHPMMPGWTPGWGPAMPGTMHPGGMMPASGMPMMGAGPMMPAGQMGSIPMMADPWSLPSEQLEASYMTWMIAHHQGAIEMASLAAKRAEHQEVKNLAASIITAQSAEIQLMEGWLAVWYGI